MYSICTRSLTPTYTHQKQGVILIPLLPTQVLAPSRLPTSFPPISSRHPVTCPYGFLEHSFPPPTQSLPLTSHKYPHNNPAFYSSRYTLPCTCTHSTTMPKRTKPPLTMQDFDSIPVKKTFSSHPHRSPDPPVKEEDHNDSYPMKYSPTAAASPPNQKPRHFTPTRPQSYLKLEVAQHSRLYLYTTPSTPTFTHSTTLFLSHSTHPKTLHFITSCIYPISH